MANDDELALKPCPFCGGQVWFWFYDDGAVNGIHCGTCRMVVRYLAPELKLKDREPYSAQMKRWADKWNGRMNYDSKDQSNK